MSGASSGPGLGYHILDTGGASLPGSLKTNPRLSQWLRFSPDGSVAVSPGKVEIGQGIVSALAVNPTLSFQELKHLLDTSDGNLSVHARKLEEADYIICTKSFAGRVPKTEYRLTETGRRALEGYLAHMEALIQVMRHE